MKWYNYRQNNSGGYFKPPAIHVSIEAPALDIAQTIALRHGVSIYDSDYCECCGLRWKEPKESDKPAEPTQLEYEFSTDKAPALLTVTWAETLEYEDK